LHLVFPARGARPGGGGARGPAGLAVLRTAIDYSCHNNPMSGLPWDSNCPGDSELLIASGGAGVHRSM
jgi:hypothetical protein